MRRLFRHRANQERADQEDELDAWPALVDVLAAAFVFMLIAFIGMLVREFGLNARLAATAAEEGEFLATQVACTRARAQYDKSLEAWSKGVVAAAESATSTYADDMVTDLLAAGVSDSVAVEFRNGCTVKKVAGEAAAADAETKAARREILMICTVPSGGRYDPDSLMHFEVGGAEPMYAPGLLRGLRAVIENALDTSCSAPDGADAKELCTAGFEIAGHADCTGTDAGRNYWELSTNRAGAVIRDLMTDSLVDQAKSDLQFTIQASGYETRVAANPDCSCDRADWRGQTECLANNRRIELRFRIRTPVLPGIPLRPECKEVRQ